MTDLATLMLPSTLISKNAFAAHQVFTAFLLGTKAFGYTIMPQIDAPEFGPCRPGGDSQTLGCLLVNGSTVVEQNSATKSQHG
jgi:hypothetical protein